MSDANPQHEPSARSSDVRCRDARRWAGLTLAFIGLCISVYLAWLTLTGRVAPGCGGGAGCGAVLGSRWSAIGPVPVSILAAGGYVAIFVLLVLQTGSAAWRRAVLGVMGAALIGAAAWFTALQAFLIGAWCLYCLAGHGVGVVLGLVLLSALPIRKLTVPVGLGVPAVMLLIGLQVLFPATGNLLEVPSDRDYDLTDASGRRIGVLDGQLRFSTADTPHTGPRDGESVVVLFLDYACPHCREAHKMLNAERPSRGGLVVFALPLSLHETHNPHIPLDHSRFEQSYELALLSLAVWRDAPAQWPAFDAWLFGGDASGEGELAWPRGLEAAERRAAELIGEERLAAVYSDAGLVARYQRNLDGLGLVLAMSPDAAPGLPIAVAPFAGDAVYGRFDEASLLDAILTDARENRPVDDE